MCVSYCCSCACSPHPPGRLCRVRRGRSLQFADPGPGRCPQVFSPTPPPSCAGSSGRAERRPGSGSGDQSDSGEFRVPGAGQDVRALTSSWPSATDLSEAPNHWWLLKVWTRSPSLLEVCWSSATGSDIITHCSSRSGRRGRSQHTCRFKVDDIAR